MQVGDAVQVYGSGPVGIILSDTLTKEWYDRAALMWKLYSYHEVFFDNGVQKIDPFALRIVEKEIKK